MDDKSREKEAAMAMVKEAQGRVKRQREYLHECELEYDRIRDIALALGCRFGAIDEADDDA